MGEQLLQGSRPERLVAGSGLGWRVLELIGFWVYFERQANWSFCEIGYRQKAWCGCSLGEAGVLRVEWPCPSPLRLFLFSEGTRLLGVA